MLQKLSRLQVIHQIVDSSFPSWLKLQLIPPPIYICFKQVLHKRSKSAFYYKWNYSTVITRSNKHQQLLKTGNEIQLTTKFAFPCWNETNFDYLDAFW